MRNKQQLNGCDYLMLAFDHELRRHGFAGNSCQIVLELGSAISAEAVRARLGELRESYPITVARSAGLFQPRWQWQTGGNGAPLVRTHKDRPGLCRDIANERLAANRGELMRFDLIQRDNGRMKLVFTWTHALMDAPGAEHFLAVMGCAELPMPKPAPPEPRRNHLGLPARCKFAWKYLHHIDRLSRAAPRSLGRRHRDAPAMMNYRVELFSAQESELIRAHSMRHCGILGAAQYHAAVATLELHELHRRLGSPSPSYVIPLPVGLRPKGSVEPIFSNQVGMLMLQFMPEDLRSISTAVEALKNQIAQGMREGLVESGRLLGELFRFLPLRTYMAILKQGFRGEIGSLFYGDTAVVSPRLTSFLGVPIEDFAHVAAVTPSPGLGVIFYEFRGQLRVTVVHLLGVLSDGEAQEFASRLRNRLLNP